MQHFATVDVALCRHWLGVALGRKLCKMYKLFILDKRIDMQYITASDAKQKFAALLDAVQRQPVTIKRQNREPHLGACQVTRID